MGAMEYLPRRADELISDALTFSGGVAIQGVKGCGKTETAKQFAKSMLQVDVDPNVAPALGINPGSLLEGETPRLVDEWQEAPLLWDLARHEIDERREPGQFIFTGSTEPTQNATKHSGAGRFVRITMSTMTFFESGDSDGLVSLRDVAAGVEAPFVAGEFSDIQLAERMCRGGWPANVSESLDQAMKRNRSYLESIINVEINAIDTARRDPERVRALLASLARNVGTECDLSTLASDADLNRGTAQQYLDALSRIFVSTDQPAWSPLLRSRTPLRKSPKRHLVDPALAMAALDRRPKDLLADLNYMGQLFESQVVHDLRVYSDNTVSHARLKNGSEVDAVVTVDGETILVEVKLGFYPQVIEKAAESLHAFAQHLVDQPRLMIVTGGGPSYTRPDGIAVVPLNRLKP